jgi:hypothetical protein
MTTYRVRYATNDGTFVLFFTNKFIKNLDSTKKLW